MTRGPFPPARTELELIADQVAGIDSWNAAGRVQRNMIPAARASREMRLDLDRRTQARRRAQAAVFTRAAHQLEHSAHVLAEHAPTRALLVHRNGWLRGKVAERLRDHGIEVVEVDDGADAIGVLVVEQPDLLLVEDRLPTLSGRQVLRSASRHAPRTVTAAQLLDETDAKDFLAAGASAVFTRRVPPPELADQFLACLTGLPEPALVG